MRLVLFVLFLCVSMPMFSQLEQHYNNVKTIHFTIGELPLRLNGSVVPNSALVRSKSHSGTLLNAYFSENQSSLMLVKTLPDSLINDIFYVTYRVFLDRYTGVYRLIDTSIIRSSWSSDLAINAVYQSKQGILTGINPNLLYRGSFTRGITLGNNQNLTLNSGFNLQVSGDLGDDVRINAALTDNAIPVQAEGNTQQLQEFDKVYIILSNKNSTLTAGDFELNRPPSYFLNYFKKLQGIQIQNESSKVVKNFVMKTSGGLAITKGKFNRLNLSIIEGNQGPYRLPGADGDAFIIVLAGTERVYLDGRLLTRGYDRDYIIDYNSGEVTFMPNILIAKESRIVVEYEYSNQQYLRSFINGGVQLANKKWDLRLNLYSEQDGKNSSYAKDITTEDKIALRAAGDSVQNLITRSFRTIEPDAENIPVTYALIDTMVNQMTFNSILVFPWRGGSARYIATFSNVGKGNGHYIRSNNNVNGRVYTWVAPDPVTGALSGEYEPIGKLVAPIQKQMATLGATFRPDSLTVINAEMALSAQDLNRFSTKNDGDNLGLGSLIDVSRKGIKPFKTLAWRSDLAARFEQAQVKLVTITPYRNPEFFRDWNLPLTVLNDQTLVSFSTQNTFGKLAKVNYRLGNINQGQQYKGTRHEASGEIQVKNTFFSANYSILNSTGNVEQTTFSRPFIQFRQSFPKFANLQIGVSFEGEDNQRRKTLDTTLLINSNKFNAWRAYIKNKGKAFYTELSYLNRIDYTPLGDVWRHLDFIDEYTGKVNWNQNKSSNLTLTTTIRNLNYVEENPSQNRVDINTYIGQVQYLTSWFKNRLNSTSLFEFSSGQERRIEFNYIPVQTGTGQYAWIDGDPKDSIQQIHEFFVSPFQDQNSFVRVSVLTDQYIPTHNSTISQSLTWAPKSSIGDTVAFRRFINQWSSQLEYRLSRKVKVGTEKGYWNPLNEIPDTSYLSFDRQYRQTVFFQRGNPAFELQFIFFDQRSRNFLSSGFDNRSINDLGVNMRIALSSKINLLLTSKKIRKTQDADFALNNNYEINGWQASPELSWMLKQNFRISGIWRYLDQRNRILQQEQSRTSDLSLQIAYNQSAKSSFKTSFSFIKNQFNGLNNSQIEFVMLEGLKKGNNLVWNLTYEHSLKDNIQLSIGYDGRKPGELRVIHTGRMQVRAYF